jgi:hypothetical protein
MVNPAARNVKPSVREGEPQPKADGRKQRRCINLSCGRGRESIGSSSFKRLSLLLAGQVNGYFFFNRARTFGRSVDKLDADPHTLKAISDFTSSLDDNTSARKSKTQLEDCPFGEFISRIDEHTVRAEVRRPHGNFFRGTFVYHREFSQLWIADILSDCNVRLPDGFPHD